MPLLHYVHATERSCADPQEARAMARIRRASIEWMAKQLEGGDLFYAFRGSDNASSHLFVRSRSHREFHQLIDADPLISHCVLDIEPLLTPRESMELLQEYRGSDILAEEDWEQLEFAQSPVEPDKTYFLARKVVLPFSPLLSVVDQNKIHDNTLISQRAHTDKREIADFNPVGKPVGILIMTAENEAEVEEHVADCEVYVDSDVRIDRLLTVDQARARNDAELHRLLVGEFAE